MVVRPAQAWVDHVGRWPGSMAWVDGLGRWPGSMAWVDGLGRWPGSITWVDRGRPLQAHRAGRRPVPKSSGA